ncbi:hypothetical protein [Gracilimonas sp.]|uniref:hypothetical protein n=1 Tax=Gracilimonas sp. TaxID=1974203 RepID=UPI0028719348|nr:hypothetical protein [Gracilimonas sp.]
MKKAKYTIAVLTFIALGIMGYGIDISTPFSGIESINVDMKEAHARDLVPGFRLTPENCPGPGPEQYDRCWYAEDWCEVEDQTVCPDPE